MLTVLFRTTAWVVHRVVEEYRAIEELQAVILGIAEDGDIGADPADADVYAEQIGFSAEQGRLRKED